MQGKMTALLVALCLGMAAADTLRLPVSNTEAMEQVITAQLAAGRQPHRRLSELDTLLAGLAASKLPTNVFSTFIDGLISEAQNFSSFTQDQLQNFNFSALGALTVDTPITAFLSELQQSTPKNLSDVENIVIDIFDEFCTAATCVLESEDDSSDKFSKSSDLSFNASLSITKSSACIGKTATLALEPWSCEFDTDSKSVTCTPAVLVLQKTPAFCELELGKTISTRLGIDSVDKSKVGSLLSDPFVYTGKSCSVEKTFGVATTDIYGADPFAINLGAMLDLSGGAALSPGSAGISVNAGASADVSATGGK